MKLVLILVALSTFLLAEISIVYVKKDGCGFCKRQEVIFNKECTKDPSLYTKIQVFNKTIDIIPPIYRTDWYPSIYIKDGNNSVYTFYGLTTCDNIKLVIDNYKQMSE